jgi:hypothetical protein
MVPRKHATDRRSASKTAPLPNPDQLPDDMDADKTEDEGEVEEADRCPPDDASAIQRPPADS